MKPDTNDQPSRDARREARRKRVPGPMTQSTNTKNPADRPLGVPGKNIEQRLDEALEETFPASDPISLRIEGE